MNGFEWLHPRHDAQVVERVREQVTFDRILDTCLEDMRHRHVSVATCLDKYPALADDLSPLLETAAALDTVNSIRPTAGFRQLTRRKLMNLPDSSASPLMTRITTALSGIPSHLAASVFGLALLAAIALGIAKTSSPILPGSPLYTVQRQVENLQLLFQPDHTGQALTHAAFAHRRLEEAQILAGEGQTQLAQQAAVEYGQQVTLALDDLRSAQQNTIQPSAAQLGAQLRSEQLELNRNKVHASVESGQVLDHALALSSQATEQLGLIAPFR